MNSNAIRHNNTGQPNDQMHQTQVHMPIMNNLIGNADNTAQTHTTLLVKYCSHTEKSGTGDTNFRQSIKHNHIITYSIITNTNQNVETI